MMSIHLLQQALHNNPFFSGGAVLMVFGGAIAYFKALPSKLGNRLLTTFTLQLTVSGEDPAFEWLLAWLHQQPYAKHTRRVAVETGSDGRARLTPAFGAHLFRYRGRPVWMSRTEAPKDKRESRGRDFSSGNAHEFTGFFGGGRNETINLRLLGRSQRGCQELLDEARACYRALQGTKIEWYQASSWEGWRNAGALPERSLDSLVLPPGVAERVLADARKFLSERAWYHDHGIPYRRGYLLYGVPGTGKSSLVHMLASTLQLPLYALVLDPTMSDDTVRSLFARLPKRCIVLLEDLDASGAAVQRTEKQESQRLSMSGLLNVLDGVGAAEGRLLFMTTNYRERLDAAIVRPGRVDLQVEFTWATHDQCERLFERFFGYRPDFPTSIAESAFTMAELQGIFLAHRSDAQAAYRAVLVQLEERRAA